MQTRQPSHRKVSKENERLQSSCIATFDQAHARLRETRDADNPPGTPEKESPLWRLQEEKVT